MDLLLKMKQKRYFFTCFSFRRFKLRVLKEEQKIEFDIKEEKINFKQLILKNLI